MTATDQDIAEVAGQVAQLLEASGTCLAVAESCTGGWITKSLTDIPGSSRWFEHGFVVYGNNAKQTMLGIAPDLLARHGAVSREVASEMALAARVISGADLAVAVTGIAGPGGGSRDKPVGTVWLAWAGPHRRFAVVREVFVGDREQIRRQTVIAALRGTLRQLADG